MTEKQRNYERILNAIDAVDGGAEDPETGLRRICEILSERVSYFDWVGFYLVDPEAERELILGPYVGEATDHTRIPFGRGICGQAADREETIVVQDVMAEDNYLSCSIDVKSEIVVPLFRDGCIVGELDIDSHQLAPFTEEDRAYLEKVAERAVRFVR